MGVRWSGVGASRPTMANMGNRTKASSSGVYAGTDSLLPARSLGIYSPTTLRRRSPPFTVTTGMVRTRGEQTSTLILKRAVLSGAVTNTTYSRGSNIVPRLVVQATFVTSNREG